MAKEVNIRVRGVQRAEPDLRRLAQALLREAARERALRHTAVQAAEPAAAPPPEAAAS